MAYSEDYIENLSKAMCEFWLFFFKSNPQFTDELIEVCLKELLGKDDKNV